MKNINKATLCFMGSALLAGFTSCTNTTGTKIVKTEKNTAVAVKDSLQDYVNQRLAIYEPVKLTTNLNALSPNQRKVLPLLIQAAQIMDELFWKQTYPQRDSLLAKVKDEKTKAFIKINYGPWDRLNGDKPFIAGIGPKPEGATFYPAGITKEEIEKVQLKDKFNAYSVIQKDSLGKLITVPYRVLFAADLQRASNLLKQAALLSEDAGFKKYLNLRADALVTDNYSPSDYAWLDMKTNVLDIIIGPIENYEDKLFNARSSFEAYVLVKDKVWSKKLAKYVSMLPELQKGLPVPEKYKKEKPGTDSELNAYDVVYYAGDCNAGSKTIAVNLPNDELIQQKKGTRRSQLKNAMKAKFDKILVPIANELIDKDQQQYVNFDAFFSNVMFHEVAHGLGIKKTVNGKGFVKAALKEQYSWLEEGKADILGLYMVTGLLKKGELKGDIKTFYTTFMAGILRSVRFGAASAHGQANMQCFNYFQEKGAFIRTESGTYKVDFTKFATAMNGLSNVILTLQGNGDKAGVEKLQKEKAVISPALQSDLDRLSKKGIPVDIVFEQGVDVLGVN
ncbi:dipeptidyl-peptidase 3 family protein [Pedobacter sp. MR2016-24]|uniref:dipeptidyl-peptidase 3 family protein n=1 Tax=Pedobacter sp. MR2016-24 TaxID=2994466 RepID=UPI00224603FE|nr:Zn-dependent hydrolase [Pedobacter sp. MR2016-24]MCX2481927.1 Zn-dependent hydrolase [Pedobacter sp. MR2016-24]